MVNKFSTKEEADEFIDSWLRFSTWGMWPMFFIGMFSSFLTFLLMSIEAGMAAKVSLAFICAAFYMAGVLLVAMKKKIAMKHVNITRENVSDDNAN